MHCTFVNYAIVIANYFDSVIANSIKSRINRLSCRKYIFSITEIYIFFKHSKTYVQKDKSNVYISFCKRARGNYSCDAFTEKEIFDKKIAQAHSCVKIRDTCILHAHKRVYYEYEIKWLFFVAS